MPAGAASRRRAAGVTGADGNFNIMRIGLLPSVAALSPTALTSDGAATAAAATTADALTPGGT